jgi:hypothetical protein
MITFTSQKRSTPMRNEAMSRTQKRWFLVPQRLDDTLLSTTAIDPNKGVLVLLALCKNVMPGIQNTLLCLKRTALKQQESDGSRMTRTKLVL